MQISTKTVLLHTVVHIQFHTYQNRKCDMFLEAAIQDHTIQLQMEKSENAGVMWFNNDPQTK